MSNKTAAELLRGLDKAATGAPWESRSGVVTDFNRLWPGSLTMEWIANGVYDLDANGDELTEDAEDCKRKQADARLIATTRNLLPLLAGLVEAVGRLVAVTGEPDESGFYGEINGVMFDAVRGAIATLNAAAAKEVI